MAADYNEEILRVIDKQGNWTGRYLPRNVASSEKDVYFNTVFCWIVIKRTHEVLFEKRSLNKKYNPGKYGLVGGHVEKDDSFIETLNKEVKEEIGINISHYKPIFLGIAKPMGLYRSFSYNYLIFIDKKFNNLQIQELEVESIVYLDYQYVKNEVINDTNKFSITYDRFNEILNKLDSILYNSDLAKK